MQSYTPPAAFWHPLLPKSTVRRHQSVADHATPSDLDTP